MTACDPDRYLLGTGRPRDIRTPARIARAIDRALLDEYRREVRGMDPELDAWLAAVHIAGLEWAEHRTTADTTAEPGMRTLPQIQPVIGSQHDRDLDVAAVAKRLGCKPRNVRDLIARQRIRAHKIAGAHRVTPEDLDAYIANKEQP